MPAGHGHSPVRASAAMLLGIALLTAGDVVTKLLAADFPAGQLLFLRHLWALAFIGAYVYLSKMWASLKVTNLSGQMLRGAAFVGTTGMMVLSLTHLPLSIVTAISFSSPILVALGSRFFLGEHVAPTRWIAILVGFCGVFLIAQPAGSVFGWSILLPMGAAVAAAIRDGTNRTLARTETSLSILFWSTCLVILTASPTLLWQWQSVSPAKMLQFAVCGLLSAGAHFLIVDAFRYAEASLVAPLRYTGLLWALGYGLAVWGHRPDLVQLLGSVLIVLGAIGLIERSTIRR